MGARTGAALAAAAVCPGAHDQPPEAGAGDDPHDEAPDGQPCERDRRDAARALADHSAAVHVDAHRDDPASARLAQPEAEAAAVDAAARARKPEGVRAAAAGGGG